MPILHSALVLGKLLPDQLWNSCHTSHNIQRHLEACCGGVNVNRGEAVTAISATTLFSKSAMIWPDFRYIKESFG